MLIPLCRLDKFDIHRQVNFSLYLNQCKKVLKQIYEKEFKKDKSFKYLKLQIYEEQIDKNIQMQVYRK